MNDTQIINGIRSRDEAAMACAMDKYARLLWSVAGTVLKNVASPEDIEECVADVFVYLWENPEKFDPQRGRLKSWLTVVARSQAVDKYRRLARESALSLDDTVLSQQLDLTEGLLAAEMRRALTAAVNALEEPDREIILRRYYYDQRPRDIAYALGLPVKQVENRLYRTKRRLRAAITLEKEAL